VFQFTKINIKQIRAMIPAIILMLFPF